jgi:hypothetical protein
LFSIAGLAVVGSLSLALPAAGQWEHDFRVTTNAASSRTEIDGGRNVIVDDGILMIVWTDTRDGNPEVYFRERIADVWSAPERLTAQPAPSMHPTIGRRPGDVRVVWEDHRMGHAEIWTKRKVLGAWTADSCVTCDDFESARPSLDHTGEHLVWEETKDGNREIYYRRRLENGNWETEFRVSDDGAESSHPSVASAHGLIFPPNTEHRIVAWQDERHGNWEIYSRLWGWSGWEPAERISSDPGSSRFPSGAIEEQICGDIATFSHWVGGPDDRHGNEEIYLAPGDQGAWRPPFRLTNTTADSRNPSVGLNYWGFVSPFGVGFCADAVVTWEERSSPTSGSIRFKDLTVPRPDIAISDAGADPEHASIAFFHAPLGPGVIEGNFGVVWADARDGNEEIYLAEGISIVDATGAPEVTPRAGTLRVELAGPNPFRSIAHFTVRLGAESELSVRVVDSTGRQVRSIFSGRKPAGTHLLSWDASDSRGRPVAAGTYFVVAKDEHENGVQRIIHLR